MKMFLAAIYSLFAAAIIAIGALIVVTTTTACHDAVPQVIRVIEDCMGPERPQIEALVSKWWKDHPSLSEIEAEALASTIRIGGCAIHEFVNAKLTPKDGNAAPSSEEGWALRALITQYKKDAKISPNVTFKTPQGNL